MLGIRYDYGIGVPRDVARAYAWYTLASINKDSMATQGRDKLRIQMTPDELARAQELATELGR